MAAVHLVIPKIVVVALAQSGDGRGRACSTMMRTIVGRVADAEHDSAPVNSRPSHHPYSWPLSCISTCTATPILAGAIL